MNAIPIRYALETVPRYTSYPTAARFEAGLSEEECRRWLRDAAGSSSISIYLHVPYCRALCWYCGCHTSVLNDPARIARYAARLRSEIALTADAASGAGPISHLHFGGGTPTILAPSDFLGVVAELRERFAFEDDAEIAVEIDPRTLEPAMAEALAQAGVNRVSLGLQDFDPQVQRRVNRVQPYDQVERAVALLRNAGIRRVNADLMYGLPGQTAVHVRASVAAALALGVERAAVFGYAHVPWFKKHQGAIDASLLPGAEERLGQAIAAQDAFAQAGWTPIGIDHYARPDDPLAIAAKAGTLRRNFQGYTTDAADVLIGVGASAIGSLNDGYVQNEPHLGEWAKRVDAGRLPIARGLRIDERDRLRRDAVMGLMATLRVDLGALAAAHGFAADHFDASLEALDDLVEDGLCVVEGRRVTVNPQARIFTRNVAARLDDHWRPEPGRHSLAV